MTVQRYPVVVAGGGPVGMVAALALHRRDIPVIVVEALSEPFVDQRAASMHPPTVAMLDQLGLMEHIIPDSLIAPVYRFHDRVTGEVVANFDLGELADELPFPYVLQYEQYKLVRKIVELYGRQPGFDMRFGNRVVALDQSDDRVAVTVELEDGRRDCISASYLIGSDGGHSAVRQLAGIPFEGFTYPEPFIKIGTYHDFMTDNEDIAYRNYFSNPGAWCNLFKVRGEAGRGIWRAVFPLDPSERRESATHGENLQSRLQGYFPKQGDYDIAYANVYTVSQRVAETMVQNRVLLAGDAAHVNNPIGGMGLNGGIHDAMSLADAVATVWKGDGDAGTLARHSRQRLRAARDFVQAQTIANKKLMEERAPAVRAKNLDALRRVADDREARRAYMRRAALIESLEAAARCI